MQRDLREHPLFEEATALHQLLRQPGSGRISDAVELSVAPDGRRAVFAATVVVFLIWLSWSVNAVFFGGAFATEIEIVLREKRSLPLLRDEREKPKLVSRSEN